MRLAVRAIFSLFLLFSAVATQAAGFTVAALAADAQAVVLADAAGQLHRYAAGDALPQAAWRLQQVRGDKAVFARRLDHAGADLTVAVAQGGSIDFAVLDARHAAPPPQPVLLQAEMLTPGSKPRPLSGSKPQKSPQR
jgi:hypothetical protein